MTVHALIDYPNADPMSGTVRKQATITATCTCMVFNKEFFWPEIACIWKVNTLCKIHPTFLILFMKKDKDWII